MSNSHWFFEKTLIESIESIEVTQQLIKEKLDVLAGAVTTIETDVHSLTSDMQAKVDALTAQIAENTRRMKEAGK